MIEVKCKICGREFFTHACRIKIGAGKYCSNECRNEGWKGHTSWNKGTNGVMKANSGSFKKGQNSGSDAYNWKGGICRDKHGGGSKYRDWRTKVFERDNYTCVECERRCGDKEIVYLQAHHVRSWADYPKDRYDVKNGITFCKECHKEFHDRFGRGKNHGGQFLAFIGYYDREKCYEY